MEKKDGTYDEVVIPVVEKIVSIGYVTYISFTFVTPRSRGSVDYPSTRGNTRECRVTRPFSRKLGRVSFVRGALPKYITCPNINHMIHI